MGERRIEVLSRVDQGTVLMLCLSLGLAIVATIYFLCRWQRKQTAKQKEAARTANKTRRKDRLKQTFSRFSQVDEELTMAQMDDDDRELLQSCQLKPTASVSARNTMTPRSAIPPSFEMAAVNQDHCAVNVHVTTKSSSGKPYLETDI